MIGTVFIAGPDTPDVDSTDLSAIGRERGGVHNASYPNQETIMLSVCSMSFARTQY